MRGCQCSFTFAILSTVPFKDGLNRAAHLHLARRKTSCERKLVQDGHGRMHLCWPQDAHRLHLRKRTFFCSNAMHLANQTLNLSVAIDNKGLSQQQIADLLNHVLLVQILSSYAFNYMLSTIALQRWSQTLENKTAPSEPTPPLLPNRTMSVRYGAGTLQSHGAAQASRRCRCHWTAARREGGPRSLCA